MVNEKGKAAAEGTSNNKQILYSALPNLAYSAGFIAALYLFKLGFAWVIGISLAYTIGLTLYQSRKGGFKLLQLLKSIGITCLFISLVYGYFFLFGGYGFLALLIFVVLLSAYLIYKGRVMFMSSMRQIETAVFGKPLDKELWKGDKPKAKRLGLSRLWRRKA